MHTALPTYLALSALFSQTATAFYPYQPPDASDSRSSSSKARRIPHPSTPDSSRSLTLPLHRVTTPLGLRPRQNAYNIVNSADPKQENSVAIDQDGGDLSYMVAVTFGDSKEEYHLLLDSAASNTWVMGQDCTSAACGIHNTFGKGDSSTLTTQTDPFNITYGTGSVSGLLASDTLHIGPLSPTVTFGLATTVSQEFRSYPMDGILGIGRGTSSSSSLIDALSSSNMLDSKLYGIHLSRNTNTNANNFADGELNLGATNPSRFTGSINYIPTTPSTQDSFWEIPLDTASWDNTPIPLPNPQKQRTAILDTGTSYILIPPSDAQALHTSIPHATTRSSPNGEIFYVPCDTNATLSFTFNNIAYNISTVDWRGGKVESEDGLCRSNIVGRAAFGEARWLVGDVFLKNVYSVFDFGEGGRVGFGVLRAEGEGEGGQSQSIVTATATATGAGAESTVAVVGSGTPTVLGVPSTTTAAGGAGSASQDQSGAQGGVFIPWSILLVAFSTISLYI
ncbi:acid protease [Plenodomus tracheiphilus IPT5]|uniref:Acid protease n=1 Tax=Plenodomus tracheiphilus IPT5 TaxID=1408161 RepID=A0A6A7ATS4_9PLEO|nr:acid protease [Plenodomus tracheiphilus IPT5]